MTPGPIIPDPQPWSKPARWTIAIALAVIVFIVSLEVAMHKKLNHDENQFVASGALLAREGLLPFRNYPYFHLPNLTFVYAVLFKFTSHLLLTARAFSVVCATGMTVLVFLHVLELLEPRGRVFALVTALGLIVMLSTSNVFFAASGSAWNHDSGTLAAVLAYLCAYKSLESRRPERWWGAAGALCSIAAGIRATFVPLGVVMLAVSLFQPNRDRAQKLKSAAAFCAAGLLCMAPIFYIWARAPQQFMWGNLYYRLLPVPNLNPEKLGGAGRARVFGMIWANLPSRLVLLGLGACLVFGIRGAIKSDRIRQYRAVLAFVCAGGLLAGSLIPSPVFVQYFYAPLPMLIISAAVMLALVPISFRVSIALCCVMLVAMAGSIRSALPEYRTSWRMLAPSHWVPVQVHQMGKLIAAHAGPKRGPVFTLSPIVPLEGGSRIYPATVNGPFAFRVASMLSGKQRKVLNIVGPGQLDPLFKHTPPSGIFVGFEPGPDGDLKKYARSLDWDRTGIWEAWLWYPPGPGTRPTTRPATRDVEPDSDEKETGT